LQALQPWALSQQQPQEDGEEQQQRLAAAGSLQVQQHV
jgi:hypothetical protein